MRMVSPPHERGDIHIIIVVEVLCYRYWPS